MVQANDINVCQDSAQSIDTPAVAGTTNSVPVVNWIAPELPCGAEIVGRDTRDETWPVLFIQQEQFRIGPYIARIGGDKERQIANQALLQQCIRKRVVIPIDYDSDFRC